MPVTKGSPGNSGSSGLVDRKWRVANYSVCIPKKVSSLCRSATVNVCVLFFMLGKRSLLTQVLLNEADTSIVVSEK